MWNLYSDGGSRPNPGKSAYCAALYNNYVLVESIGGYMGESTNNKAEYKAFYTGLKLIEEHCDIYDEINIYLDSKLVLKQTTKEWKVKDESLKDIATKCQEIVEHYTHMKFTWIKSHSGNEGNTYVDTVCTYFIEKCKNDVIVEEKEDISKIYINCPYSEKDEAKQLGAKWDCTEKKWYIPSELIDQFEKWL